MWRTTLKFTTGLIIFALVWETIARSGLVPINLFPNIDEVAAAFAKLTRSGELSSAAIATFGRAALGLTIGCAIALPLSLMATQFSGLRRALEPIVDILRTLPPPALVPLLIFTLGLNQIMFMVVIVFSAVLPIYIACVVAFAATERLPLLTARSFGASSRWQLLHVRLPSALPAIFTGIRVGLGFSLMAAIATEMIAGTGGLGSVLFDAAFSLRIAEMYATLLAAGFGGVLLNSALAALKYPFVNWHSLQVSTNKS